MAKIRFNLLIACVLMCFSVAHADNQKVAEQKKQVCAVIEAQILAFQAKDHNRAYSYAGESVRNAFPSPESFASMVMYDYDAIYNPLTYLFGETTASGDLIYQLVILTDQTGNLWEAFYTMEKNAEGAWKITDVFLRAYDGSAA